MKIYHIENSTMLKKKCIMSSVFIHKFKIGLIVWKNQIYYFITKIHFSIYFLSKGFGDTLITPLHFFVLSENSFNLKCACLNYEI